MLRSAHVLFPQNHVWLTVLRSKYFINQTIRQHTFVVASSKSPPTVSCKTLSLFEKLYRTSVKDVRIFDRKGLCDIEGNVRECRECKWCKEMGIYKTHITSLSAGLHILSFKEKIKKYCIWPVEKVLHLLLNLLAQFQGFQQSCIDFCFWVLFLGGRKCDRKGKRYCFNALWPVAEAIVLLLQIIRES